MKIILCFAMVFLVNAFELHPDETHDHETIASDLDNVRERLDCILDRKPCNAILRSYLEQSVKLLETSCATCDMAAKKFIYAFMETVKKNYPEDYDAAAKKFDPEGKYLDKLVAAISEA